jgi:hypothetical protein
MSTDDEYHRVSRVEDCMAIEQKDRRQGGIYWLYTLCFVGIVSSGLASAACVLLIGSVRVPEFFDAPIGVKHTPLDGLPALADAISGPCVWAFGLFFVGLWITLSYEERHPRRRNSAAH